MTLWGTPTFEQHSADMLTFILGSVREHRWTVVVRGKAVATFRRREDARRFVRAKKSLEALS